MLASGICNATACLLLPTSNVYLFPCLLILFGNVAAQLQFIACVHFQEICVAAQVALLPY